MFCRFRQNGSKLHIKRLRRGKRPRSKIVLTLGVLWQLIHLVLPFEVQHQPGKPVSEQLIYAVKKAVAQGRLKPGDAFPSVRALSRELRINPNTAQKAVAHLTQAGILEIEPGIGARVRAQATVSSEEVATILDEPLEALAIEAKRLGLTLEQLDARLRKTWKNLNR